MKHIAVLLGLAAGFSAVAQETRLNVQGSGGFGLESHLTRLFDPATVITFSGRVSGVSVSPYKLGQGSTTTMLVKTPNGGTAIVDLGPSWYVDGLGVNFKIGDRVSVTGSKVILNGRGLIFAGQVGRNGQVLALRDGRGTPYWVAMRPPDRVLPAIPGTPVPVQPQPAEPVTSQPVVILPPPGVGAGGLVRPLSGQVTLAGRIAQFLPALIPGSDTEYVLAVIQTDTASIPVLLGPRWYLERQDAVINVGDLVTMDTWTPPGSAVRQAWRVTSGSDMLVLSTPDGWPVWAGWFGPVL